MASYIRRGSLITRVANPILNAVDPCFEWIPDVGGHPVFRMDPATAAPSEGTSGE